MPSPEDVIIVELSKSRGGTDDAVDMIYFAYGSDDSSAVRTAIINKALEDFPDGYDNLQFGGLASLRVVDDDEFKWEGVIRFGIGNWSGVGEIGNAVLVSFSTVGGTERIWQSKQTVAKYPSDAPDYNGAIAVANGHPAGAEVVAPIFNFSIRMKFYAPGSVPTSTDISGELINIWRDLTAHTNDNDITFVCVTRYGYELRLPFKKGELLFRGCEAPEQDNNGNVVTTFHFSAGINRSDENTPPNPIPLDFIGSSGTINKGAWEYLWFAYRQKLDGSANATVPRPTAAYVERNYDPADFTLLGLPYETSP